MNELKRNNKNICAVSATIKILTVLFVAVLLLTGCVDLPKNAAVLHGEASPHAMVYSDKLLPVSVGSPQCFVYDVSNDTIIYTKGEAQVVYPGSTTKLLTALYALTLLDPDEIITPGNELELVKPGSSLAYIKSYHKLTVEMLVGGMLIPSGNDAAYVLAAAAGKKLAGDNSIDGKTAVDRFMDGLKKYSAEIGLCGTSFNVPDGYDGSTHYTTTEDMIIISKLAIQNEIIAKYTSKARAVVVYESGHLNEWNNTNKLLDEDSRFYSKYVTGLKTGSIDGECSLVFSFSFEDGRQYIAGVFGSPNKDTRFYDALEIIQSLK